MNIRQAMKMAFKSILGNKGRSFLTMLGIIIGIASVMTIVSTINGMNKRSLEQMEAMGTNRITVSAYLYNGQNAFEALYDYCNSLGSKLVQGVTPTGYCNATVVYGSKSSAAMEKNQQNMFNGDRLPEFQCCHFRQACTMAAISMEYAIISKLLPAGS